MAKYNDYKIVSHYMTPDFTTEKFKIVHGGQIHSVHATIESAQLAVQNLESDPWFFDRGQTRADRNKK